MREGLAVTVQLSVRTNIRAHHQHNEERSTHKLLSSPGEQSELDE